jgi:pyrimidine operon attenuation protein/uracil phosphoribosyltransferase
MDIKANLRTVRFWFIVALVLKAICAVLSFYVGTFFFGLVVPIAVMAGYWWVGNRIRDNYDTQLPVAKFADSVYYLGFLFTVGSIIVCLIDIQSIGDNLSGMAMRFGAALVSTGIGMVARTLCIGFKADPDEVAESVHAQALKASDNLAHMFEDAYQELVMFRDNVIATSRDAVSSVQEQITEMSKRNMAEMDKYFVHATERSNEAFAAMLSDVKGASDEMLTTISGLAERSEQTLERMESHSLEFGEKASARLEHTLFPDDLFAKKLSPALDTLADATDGVNTSISTLTDDVKTAARAVGTAIRGLNTKTQSLEENLAALGNIVDFQQRLMDSITEQGGQTVTQLERIQREFLSSLDGYHKGQLESASANREVMSKLADRFQEVNQASETSFRSVEQGIATGIQTVVEQGAKSSEALAMSILDTLKPLIEAMVDSNKVHGEMAARVEHSNADAKHAHAQLDELTLKIEHLSKIEVIQPAVNEASIAPGASLEFVAVNDAIESGARPA